MRWDDFLGKYVMHCHNVVHEDHAMMIRWDIVPKKQARVSGSSPGARARANSAEENNLNHVRERKTNQRKAQSDPRSSGRRLRKPGPVAKAEV
jgi:hypothetical protein